MCPPSYRPISLISLVSLVSYFVLQLFLYCSFIPVLRVLFSHSWLFGNKGGRRSWRFAESVEAGRYSGERQSRGGRRRRWRRRSRRRGVVVGEGKDPANFYLKAREQVFKGAF